jgi:hypothetical protein
LDRGQSKRRGQPAGAGVWIKRLAIITFFAMTLAAAGWAVYPYRDRLLSWIGSLTAGISMAPVVSPLTGYAAQPQATDAAFQRAGLWQVLKRDHPEWYEARVRDVSAAVAAQKPLPEVHRAILQATLELRRKYAGDALSATPPKLITLASAFADTLVRLRQVGVDACYTFIVNGEVSPAFADALADPERAGPYQAQLIAVFEAIADGRRLPRIYPQPKQADYNLLVARLEARGWSERDMALFSNSQAFGQAPPEKVCKMVTDWFQSQLELKDEQAQLRLLADSLRPVVAG